MRKSNILIILCILGMYSCNLNNKNQHNDLFEKQVIKETLNKVANWQINNISYLITGNLHDYGIDAWTNSTFYLGLSQWAKTSNNDAFYLTYLDNIGKSTNWTPPANFANHPKYQLYHADEFCISQFYLNMYDIYKDEEMLIPTQERADRIINHPPDTAMDYKNKQSWTWCDALFMAPPVYAHLSLITGDEKYLIFMDKEFKRTYEHLYDRENKLFFRDDSYFDKREENGEKIFWGRGNGWVAAGIVNILKLLPENSEYRSFYVDVYKEFIPRLIELQDTSGFWHASLLDPENYPAPETSATALITYAIAYGINNGLLCNKEYASALKKGWGALVSVIDENGKLGWVQPVGADPKKVRADMTASYGVGAFLLAGNEIYLTLPTSLKGISPLQTSPTRGRIKNREN